MECKLTTLFYCKYTNMDRAGFSKRKSRSEVFLHGPTELCEQKSFREASSHNDIGQWCEKARPERVTPEHGWRTVPPFGSTLAVKLKPSYLSRFWRKFCCDSGWSYLDWIALTFRFMTFGQVEGSFVHPLVPENFEFSCS